MLTRWLGLPVWTRRDHPVMRHELKMMQRGSRASRLGRALIAVVTGGLLLLVGYLIASNLLQNPAGSTPLEGAFNTVYIPLIGLLLFTRIAAFIGTVGAIREAETRSIWDSLRAAEYGAPLTLFTRWAAAIVRVRGGLIVSAIVRGALILGMLWELMGYQGGYLDLLTSGVTPDVGGVGGIPVLACAMAAALLLPLTGALFDGALGLWIGSLARGRTGGGIAQALFVIARVAIAVALLVAAAQFLNGQLIVGDGAAWLLIFAAAAMGDGALLLLHLGSASEIWAAVPFGILLGPALLLFALLQTAAADVIANMAARRAQREG